MDKDRREIGKRAIVDMRRQRDLLYADVARSLKKIYALDDQIREVVDDIIDDGDEQYE